MLNQKYMSGLIVAMFLMGGSAFAYAAPSTTPDVVSVTPSASTPVTPSIPYVESSLDLETPDVADAPEIPEVAELPEAMEAPEVAETHASK